MNDRDARYLRMRMTEERERALRAPTAEASVAHRAFARIYQQRLESGQPEQRTGSQTG